MAGRKTRMLLMFGMAAGLSAGLAAPSLAQSSTHRHHVRTTNQQANPNGQANPNSAGMSFGAAQHAGQCWIPTDRMNPNSSFGYWGDCNTKGSVPMR